MTGSDSHRTTLATIAPEGDGVEHVESVLDTLVDHRIALLNERVAILERNARENERLVADLLAQATSDFEERTWLRRLFNDIHDFESDSALLAVRRNLLAPLRHLLAARCVRLLPVDSGDGIELPHVVVGESPLDAEACRQFTQDLYDLTASHRFVFNRGPLSHDDHIVPDGVEAVIAIGVSTNDRLRGWLLAFDKLAGLIEPGVRPAGASETEFGTIEFSLAECAASSLAARLRLLEAADSC